MISSENVTLDGMNLIRYYSDNNKKIRGDDENIYPAAYVVRGSTNTFTETNLPLNEITSGQIISYKDVSGLSDYVNAEISSKADVSSVPQISVDGYKSDVSFLHVSDTEYYKILEKGAISNVVYVVSSEYNNMYGMQVKNVQDGTDISDAVNLGQLFGLSDELSTKADVEDTKYVFNEIQSGQIEDMAVNYLSIDAATQLSFPPPGNRVRDFIVTLDIPQTVQDFGGLITFTPSGQEEVHFYVDGSDPSTAQFPVPSLSGTWSYSFTEMKQGWFAVSLKQMVEVAPPSNNG